MLGENISIVYWRGVYKPVGFPQSAPSTRLIQNTFVVSRPYTKSELNCIPNTAEKLFSDGEGYFFRSAFLVLGNSPVHLSDITNEELQCRLLEEMKRMSSKFKY